jgi:hypothetical protein
VTKVPRKRTQWAQAPDSSHAYKHEPKGQPLNSSRLISAFSICFARYRRDFTDETVIFSSRLTSLSDRPSLLRNRMICRLSGV